jgi:DNA topoisomerase I
LEAYCVKCKLKREIKEPLAVFNAKGNAATQGICPVCGTKLYRMGKTEAHAGLEKPIQEIHLTGKLVVVESPAKARTVGNFLGKEYTVRASVGHVRDLLRSTLSVDVENDFEPKYRVPNEKKSVVKDLKAEVKKAAEIYLATDPDREGQAIAWHLKEATGIPEDRMKRVVFHEITKPAIAEAFANPRKIDMDLVDAQQARRILDRLVGYNLSPLLWEKVRNRLTAGRVQSVALRLIVEREREIQAFIPREFWTIDAEFNPTGTSDSFIARLVKIDEKEAQLPTQILVDEYLDEMKDGTFKIGRIKKSERRRNAFAPFITSTMQQQASRKMGYTARRTMSIAQQLYEGIDVGEGGTTGLITYMRTDSTNISDLALQDVRKYIEEVYGKEFLPEQAARHKTRAVVAQEAHEAIRPTSVFRTPEKIKVALSSEQFKLYQLIWRRFVASQMEAAIFDTMSVEVDGKGRQHHYLFRASGSQLRFAGFLILYEEASEEEVSESKEENIKFPKNLAEGQDQSLKRLIPEQHFTQSPPRYTEASLVQVLEENGIGRPSTYAPILTTIQARGYVIREARKLFPTETGFLVNDLMVEYFPDILGVHFTAGMEQDLDQIAAGKQKWTNVLHKFYEDFKPKLEHARSEMPETKMEPEKVGKPCPTCGKDLIIRWGRYGKFISCSSYPACRYTEPFLEKTGVSCPEDGGDIVIRKTRKGRIFYGCINYPNCSFTTWNKPLKTVCPNCGGLLVVKNKNEAQCVKCEETFLLEKLPTEGEN